MIKNIKINKDNENFNRLLHGNAGDFLSLDLKKGVNIITSENGSGKSTLFDLLQERIMDNHHQDTVKLETYYKKGDQPRNFFFFQMKDLEAKNQLNELSPADPMHSEKLSLFLNRTWKSHGQSNNDIMEDIETLSENSDFIFIDEPELALDTFNLIKFINKIKLLSKNTQFCIISHHPYFIFNNDFNIIDLTNDDYLTRIKESLNSLNLSI